MQFSQLHLSPSLLSALKVKGYQSATPIQQQAIPVILSGKDVIGKAPTGTGKTAAFMLPALHKIAESEHRQKPQVLVLSPTRELANQITAVIHDYGKDIHVKPVSILGGMPYRDQQRKLSKPHDIIIGTPGRLMDYIRKGALDLSRISLLILDEADRMLDMGFIEDVEFIASKLSKKRQTLLFTATMDNRLISLSKNILQSPQFIEVKNENVTLDNISQRIHIANDNEHKFKLLKHLLTAENIFKAVIFSGTKHNADRLARDLEREGLQMGALHGDMNQKKRNRTIADFRTGKIQFLVATDVAARGIDINDVSHVINYDLPKFAEDYVHRIGRTGRAGREGIAISFVSSNDRHVLQKIERFTRQTIPHSTIKGLEPHSQPKSSSSHKSKKSFGGKPKRSFGGNSDRDFGHKPKKKFGDKFKRDFSDRPERNFNDRSEKRDFRDKPKKNFGGNFDRGNFGDKPKKKFGDKFKRDFSDRPERNFNDRSEKRDFRDKPKKNFGGNFDRGNFGDKPKKKFGDKFKRDFSDRPERNFNDRSEKRDFRDKPKKNFGGNFERGNFGDKHKKKFGDKFERNFDDKPKKNFGNRDFAKKDFGKSFNKDSKKPFKKKFKKDKK